MSDIHESSNTEISSNEIANESIQPHYDALSASVGVSGTSESAEIATLKADIEALRLQLIAASVTKGATGPLGRGQQESAREKAIRAVGGLAFWNQLTPEQRSAMLGVSENASNDEVKKYFGPTSNGADAQSLAKQNPARYKLLRVLARERGIF